MPNCSIVGTQLRWSAERQTNGQRSYGIAWLIRGDKRTGPYEAMNCPGLPVPGSTWNFYNDRDDWAYCQSDLKLSEWQKKDNDGPWRFWFAEQTFSTQPLITCRDAEYANPLLEPPLIAGSFIQEFREITHDLEGRPIKNSAHEPLYGHQVEFEFNRPTVHIEQNVAALQLPLLCQMVNRVNMTPMWGLPPRCIKLSSVSWSKQYYGRCYAYYRRVFDFDVNFDSFDRIVLDEGTKVLNGHWDETTGKYVIDPILIWNADNTIADEIEPDPNNPQHFKRYVDRDGNLSRVILNGHGLPAETVVVQPWQNPNEIDPDPPDQLNPNPGRIFIRYYREANMFMLNLPTSF